MKSAQVLPVSLNPLRFADSNRALQGTVRLAGMPRLLSNLANPEGSVAVSLHFYRDDSHRPVLDGNIDARLTLVCQRCMGQMAWDLRLPIALGIVQTQEQAEKLDENRDPLLVEDETVRLSELVEDELILGLPTIAMHPVDSPDCIRIKADKSVSKEVGANGKHVQPSDKNPFAVLAPLINRADTDKD